MGDAGPDRADGDPPNRPGPRPGPYPGPQAGPQVGPYPGHHPGPVPTPREPSVLSPAAEALGYSGGILTTLAVLYELGDVWTDLGGGAQTLLLALATIALSTAAGFVGAGDRIAARLSTTLWLLAGMTGTLTSYILFDRVAGLGADAGLLAAGGTASAAATALWRRTDRGFFGALAFLGGLVAVFGGVGLAGGGDAARATAIWTVGIVWVTAGVAVPRLRELAPLSLGALAACSAAQAVVADAGTPGLLLGLLTAVVLTGAAISLGTTRHWVWAGFAGLVFVPQAILEWVPVDIAWPLAMMTAGIGMMSGCITLVLRRRRGPGEDG